MNILSQRGNIDKFIDEITGFAFFEYVQVYRIPIFSYILGWRTDRSEVKRRGNLRTYLNKEYFPTITIVFHFGLFPVWQNIKLKKIGEVKYFGYRLNSKNYANSTINVQNHKTQNVLNICVDLN